MDMNFHFGFSCVFCFGFRKHLYSSQELKFAFMNERVRRPAGAELKLKCLAHVWPALPHITSLELYSNNLDIYYC